MRRRGGGALRRADRMRPLRNLSGAADLCGVSLSGFFYDSHRAAHDCAAGIALLNSVLAKSGERAMARLLQTARPPIWRIWAEGAPFGLKDILKARGFRWNV